MSVPRILIIAGSDSGGGAGIQADIKTVTMLGGHAMTAVTAITAQNTLGVQAVMPVPAGMVVAQIDSVVGDIGVDAVKIGMIGSAETASAIADRLERLNAERSWPVPTVFDPVMVATSGAALADPETVAVFRRLQELATVITPNVPELIALTGMPVTNPHEQFLAAESLACRTGYVLAKGGHAEGAKILDILVDSDGRSQHFESDRIESPHTHGTGCTLASAIATLLGRRVDLPEAVRQARAFVRSAIAAAPGLGGGHGPMGHALGAVPFDLIHRKD
jgi:hydroxymethylpyrimidine/phosphomethylpyrimidine kinase